MLGFTAGASARGGTPSNARGAELGLRLVKDREGLWGVILESEIVSKVSRGGFSVSQQAGGGGSLCLLTTIFYHSHHRRIRFQPRECSVVKTRGVRKLQNMSQQRRPTLNSRPSIFLFTHIFPPPPDPTWVPLFTFNAGRNELMPRLFFFFDSCETSGALVLSL